MDNYNYPMGADTPDAPWNQEITEMEKYDVEVNYTLTKNMTVSAFSEEDEDMFAGIQGASHSPLQLIAILKVYVEKDLKANPSDKRKQKLLKECEGFTQNIDFWPL